MKITIGKKIAFSFSVILILLIGMAGITYQGFKNVIASIDKMELETVKRGSAGNLRFNITQLLMPANDFILTGNQHYKSAFDSLNSIVNKNFNEFRQLLLTKNEKQFVIQIKNDLDSIRSYSQQIFLISEPQQSLKTIRLMETMDYHFASEVNQKTTQIFDEISKRVEETILQAADIKENVTKTIFGVTFLGIFISIIVAFFTVRRISKPIITLAKAADSIANGDYSHHVVIVKTHDEVAFLAKSFNQMSESIQQSQKELKESEKRFRSLYENSTIGLYRTTPAGKIILANPTLVKMLGYSSFEELAVRDLEKDGFEPAYERKLFLEQIEMKGEVTGSESAWNRKDGSVIYVRENARAHCDSNGKSLYYDGTIEDITERKRTEQELINAKEKVEEMSRLKSNFLANMSHELKTPLNGIMGYADLLTSQLVEPEQIEMTQGIFDSGKRLNETLNFILDLTNAETDTIEVIAKDIAVAPLAKNSINSFAKEATKKNLQLETIIKEENIYAHLDERLFTRILYNLLDNAIKFTKKGEIIVEIGKEVIAEKDWLYIKVKDTGIGIAHNKIDLIWDEFRQVSEGLTRSYEGPGLGLTISKKAVELMQGVISVESELEIGSIFTVKFPSVNAIPQKEEFLQEKQAAVIQPEKERAKTTALPLVLCVEDDFINRDIVKLFLKNTCVVVTAEDGETALQLAAEKKYDLILMDINLGKGMNGMEVVKELLKMPKYADTPIIAVTAYAMGKDKAEFLKSGGTDYISKPFYKREILDLVKSVLKNK